MPENHQLAIHQNVFLHQEIVDSVNNLLEQCLCVLFVLFLRQTVLRTMPDGALSVNYVTIKTTAPTLMCATF